MHDVLKSNNVHVSGRGEQAIVFAHGFGTDQSAWRWVAPAFEGRFTVVRFDHLGCGGSDLSAWREARHGSLDGYAADLLEILDALELPRVHYVGHSAGALIGLLASIAQPGRFARMALVGASPCFVDDPAAGYRGGFQAAEIDGILDLMERDQIAWAGALAPLALGADAPPALADDFGSGLRQIDPLVARRFGGLVFRADLREKLPLVTVPTLLLHCRRDSLVPPEVAGYLHRQLRGSVLRWIEAHGHCPHMSHPQQTTALLDEYLSLGDAG